MVLIKRVVAQKNNTDLGGRKGGVPKKQLSFLYAMALPSFSGSASRYLNVFNLMAITIRT